MPFEVSAGLGGGTGARAGQVRDASALGDDRLGPGARQCIPGGAWRAQARRAGGWFSHERTGTAVDRRTTTARIGAGWLAAGLVVVLASGAAWADEPTADQPVANQAPATDKPAADVPSGQDLLSMAVSLRGPDATSQAGRKQLVALIEGKHLASVAAARSVSPGQWKDLVAELSGDLSPQSRQAWLAGVRAAFAPNPVDLQSLSGGDALTVASVCYALGDPQADTLLDQLEPMWVAGKVDWGNCKEVARTWQGRDGKKAQVWAVRACQGLVVDKRDWLDSGDMAHMAGLFSDLGMNGGFSEFAMMVTMVARQGKLDGGIWDHCPVSARELGEMLLTAQSRQPLYVELTNAQGHVRAGVSEVLAWAHYLSATPMEWVKYLDDRIAATSGDAKAYWLMARAYAQTVNLCGATDPFEGRTFINQAYSTAQSDEARLYVAGRIAMGYAYCVERARGQAFLDGVAGQFTGQAQETFAKLRKDFDYMCTENEQWLQGKRALFAAREAAARQERLTSLLEAARRKGDAKAVGALERALAESAKP